LSSKSDAGSIKPSILAFGAHPDDIEFGCGGVVASETANGANAHFVICSRGEAATNGTPETREEESRRAAALLGATVEFVDFGGDSHIEISTKHTTKLAHFIRKYRPSIVLAPSCVENQHPDHSRIGKMVRDAARLARYGGMKELQPERPWAIEQLLYYAVTPDGVPTDVTPILIDVSAEQVITAWMAAMKAHESQAATRNYLDLQLARAKVLGAQAGVEYAVALYPNDALLFSSLSAVGKGVRRF
jgi:LmbE family N-acetylglucosaminyl deacetylase